MQNAPPPAKTLDNPDKMMYTDYAFAGVVELADAPDSKSGGLIIRIGSTPITGTKKSPKRISASGDFYLTKNRQFMKYRIYEFSVIIIMIIATLCTGCGAPHAHDYVDGKCADCGEVCSHSWDGETRCSVCGIQLSNTVQELPCASENGNIYGRLFLPSVYYGKLRTVIVCHGFNVNMSNTVPTLLARRGYACYAFDFCGGSPTTKSDMAMEDMTILTEKADLLAVHELVSGLPTTDTDNIYLYGESQGGLVCALTAAELSDRIAGLIMMYPGFSIVSEIALRFGSKDALPDRIEVLGKDMKRSYADAVFEFAPSNFTVTDSPLAADILRNRLDITADLYNYISTYSGRTVIFHGTKDPLVDIAFSEEAIEYYDHAKLYKVHGEEHGFGHSNLIKTIERIDAFLSEK